MWRVWNRGLCFTNTNKQESKEYVEESEVLKLLVAVCLALHWVGIEYIFEWPELSWLARIPKVILYVSWTEIRFEGLKNKFLKQIEVMLLSCSNFLLVFWYTMSANNAIIYLSSSSRCSKQTFSHDQAISYHKWSSFHKGR